MPSLKTIVEHLNADSAAIMMPDVANRHLYCYDNYAMPSEWVAIKNSFDEKISGGNIDVYNTSKPAITNHLQKVLEGYHIESVLIVPIIRGTQTIAMLEVIHDNDNKTFSDADLQEAESFAKELETKLP